MRRSRGVLNQTWPWRSHVAASIQTQAFCAIPFLYMYVLRTDLPMLGGVRAKRPKRLPVVLSRDIHPADEK